MMLILELFRRNPVTSSIMLFIAVSSYALIPWWIAICLPPILLTLLSHRDVQLHFREPGKEPWKPKIFSNKLTTRDETEIQYYVSEGKIPIGQPGSKIMLFAQPLGACGFEVYSPILYQFGDEYTYITWDYRGLFSSDQPKRIRRISIPEHAEDAVEILKALNISTVDVMVGHSMGVQVTLETVVLYPEKVTRIVLLNGTYGQVFSSAFQPVFRVPLVSDFACSLVNAILKRHWLLVTIRNFLKPIIKIALPIWANMFGSKLMKRIMGPDYLVRVTDNYLGTIAQTEKNTINFLRLFQELDAHSVYHLLRDIEHPTLIVSGCWDFLTPAYQSFEMSRQMKNSTHCFDWLSSHFSILENPELVLDRVEKFLRTQFSRINSSTFSNVVFDSGSSEQRRTISTKKDN